MLFEIRESQLFLGEGLEEGRVRWPGWRENTLFEPYPVSVEGSESFISQMFEKRGDLVPLPS